MQGNAVISSLQELRQRRGFKVLNIQKQKLEFVRDKRENINFVPSANLTSQFYTKQTRYLVTLLGDARSQQGVCSNQNTALLEVVPLHKTVNVEAPRFIGRQVLTVQTSVCSPSHIGLVVDDKYYLISSQDRKYSQIAHCLSVETYDITNGHCV